MNICNRCDVKVASVCECANLILFIIIDSPLLLKKVHISVFQRLNKYTWSIGNCSIGDSWRSFQFDSLYSRNSYKSDIGFSTRLRFFFNYLTLYKGWPSPSFIFYYTCSANFFFTTEQVALGLFTGRTTFDRFSDGVSAGCMFDGQHQTLLWPSSF